MGQITQDLIGHGEYIGLFSEMEAREDFEKSAWIQYSLKESFHPGGGQGLKQGTPLQDGESRNTYDFWPA